MRRMAQSKKKIKVNLYSMCQIIEQYLVNSCGLEQHKEANCYDGGEVKELRVNQHPAGMHHHYQQVEVLPHTRRGLLLLWLDSNHCHCRQQAQGPEAEKSRTGGGVKDGPKHPGDGVPSQAPPERWQRHPEEEGGAGGQEGGGATHPACRGEERQGAE